MSEKAITGYAEFSDGVRYDLVWNGAGGRTVGRFVVRGEPDVEFVPVRECEDVMEPPGDGVFWPAPRFKCSACGTERVSMDYVDYCPRCGARVRDELS